MPPQTHTPKGIDDTIKIWTPTAPERRPVPPEAARVMERNAQERAAAPRAVLPVPPELLQLLIGRRRLRGRFGGVRVGVGGGGAGGDEGSESGGEDGEEEGDEDDAGCRMS